MSGLVQKSETGELDMQLSWRSGYLNADEAIADDLGWSVQPVSDAKTDLRVVFQDNDASKTRLRLEGGVAGQIYSLIGTVRTTGARLVERAILVRVHSQRNSKTEDRI